MLYFIATPIGNLSDISLRALETLKSVDLIACEDTRHSIKLLNHFEIKKPLIAYHKFNEKKQAETLIEELKNGKNITLEPMSAYERKIIHSKLQKNPKIETYSIGEGDHRRVVIAKK